MSHEMLAFWQGGDRGGPAKAGPSPGRSISGEIEIAIQIGQQDKAAASQIDQGAGIAGGNPSGEIGDAAVVEAAQQDDCGVFGIKAVDHVIAVIPGIEEGVRAADGQDVVTFAMMVKIPDCFNPNTWLADPGAGRFSLCCNALDRAASNRHEPENGSQ
ncbi:hypothetical protein [Paracoccus halophilus]|uniref:hypothetical protein n=1 Tax=Paracoccus halophilus TaxID=376733 RepID=UPI0011138BFF|nr:hypothetical protein [Paracoccus halophilus]